YEVYYAYYPGTGLLSTVTDSDERELAEYTSYEPTGKMGQVDYGNNTTTVHTYDPYSTKLTGIVTSNGSGNLLERYFAYSQAGDIQEIDDQHNSITYTYTYDNLHRLLGETNTGSYDSVSYTYNAIGNITSKTVGTDTFAYSYDGPQAHAVSKVRVNDTTDYLYDYDDNGNMTDGWNFANLGSVAARDISYNADNKPVSIVMSGATTQFVYDGKGTRAKKVVSGGSITYYVGKHFEIKDSDTIKYVFAGNTRIAKITASDIYYYHKDHLGSSAVMTDATGAQVEATEYMAFGGQRDHTGTEVTDYKYTGQELDTSTGLYNYRARLYDPLIGRFISPDTIVQGPSDPQTLNRYSYCRNNPLIYVDPSGHSMISSIMAQKSSSVSKVSSIMAKKSSSAGSSSSMAAKMIKAKWGNGIGVSLAGNVNASIKWVKEGLYTMSRDDYWNAWLGDRPGLSAEQQQAFSENLNLGCNGLVANEFYTPASELRANCFGSFLRALIFRESSQEQETRTNMMGDPASWRIYSLRFDASDPFHSYKPKDTKPYLGSVDMSDWHRPDGNYDVAIFDQDTGTWTGADRAHNPQGEYPEGPMTVKVSSLGYVSRPGTFFLFIQRPSIVFAPYFNTQVFCVACEQ
ncbi:MAG: RHS repeat-associated core domain-containing protein, partial [Thermodesulfobacteriota bacterium]|nr:RHS repeat-associated core domain-containing protein [Thermodesulfobacteriota bacterium]